MLNMAALERHDCALFNVLFPLVLTDLEHFQSWL